MSLKNFVLISKYLGSNFAYAQGAGGNTSVKLDSKSMVIKSSGINLSEVNDNIGYCHVDYSMVNNAIKNKTILTDKESSDFSLKIKVPATQSSKPSMEYGIHAMLKKNVLHSHSVYLAVLLCAKIDSKEFETLTKDFLLLDYYQPGIHLTYALENALKKFSVAPSFIFLKNHGMVIHHDDAQKAIDLHEELNNLVLKKYKMDIFTEAYPAFDDFDFMKNNILFPDQMVFSSSLTGFNSAPGIQMRRVYNYLLKTIASMKLEAVFLPTQDAADLLSMESEKYRQQLKGQN